jgi:hypothetical protein
VQHRFLDSGKVTLLTGHEYRREGLVHLVTSRLSGKQLELKVRRRVVDAAYLAPSIPATSAPPFGLADGARVVTINELVSVADAPSQYVIAGSGKTATDAIVWLLSNGVEPDRIVWVRPRDPWMLNRAVVQPDPAVFRGLAADTMVAATQATSLDDLFVRLEAAGAMLRIDPDVVPTMARTPTLGVWELDLLRTVEAVVRMGHVRHVAKGEMVLQAGVVPLASDALVVHCAASGLQNPPMVPIWGRDRIRLQTIRAGFPCFCAALAGYVEATRDDDRERNRLCPPNLYGNTLTEWARMQTRGARAAAAFGAQPDISAWANSCMLNPSRVDPEQRDEPAVRAAATRLDDHAEHGLARLAEFAQEPLRVVRVGV